MPTFVATVVLLLVIATPALAQDPKPSVEIRTEYLMTIDVPLERGILVGQRVIVNVGQGGTVRGPKIKGEVLAPSGDWFILMPDGSGRLDVRGTIKTDDNAFIFVEYGGVVLWPKETQDRITKGEAVSAADGYFVTAPRFMTTSPIYAWLNHIQAVGKVVSFQRGVRVKYDVFVVK
jgi:hypothetical protein